MPLLKALIVDKATDGKFLEGFKYKEDLHYDHLKEDPRQKIMNSFKKAKSNGNPNADDGADYASLKSRSWDSNRDKSR